MKSKDLLNEIAHRQKMIVLKLEQLDRLRTMCGVKSVSYDVERVQGSPTRENSAIIEYIQMKSDIDDYVAETARMKRTVMTALDNFSNEQIVKIIYEHYLNGKSLVQISTDLGMTLRRVQQLNGTALAQLNKYIS